MNVTIKSDGTPFGTRVLTAAGEDLNDKVQGVRFTHGAGELPSAALDLCLVAIDATGVQAFAYINGKEVRRVEYADGTSDEFGAD